MRYPLVLSYLQAQLLLSARNQGLGTATISLDLGLSTREVALLPDRVALEEDEWLTWEDVEEIAGEEMVCFEIEDHQPEKIQQFSELMNRFYSLMPTTGAPTLLISGIPMHRIKGVDPHRDTLTKVRTVSPIAGRVLDTCTGLGYTAIEAAKKAEQVVTVELDPMVLEVAELNPWSRALFENPRIEQRVGDAFDVVQDLEDAFFSLVIHDPPMFNLAGDLYSAEFYGELHRVLRHRGRMFHYVGDLDSKSGRNVVRGVTRRLQEVGFTRVVRKPEAFGVVAYK